MGSSATLATMRTRVQNFLWDVGAAVWGLDQIDEAIRQALGEISRVRPLIAHEDVVIPAGSREVALSAGVVSVVRVWFPYDADDEPDWAEYEVWHAGGTQTLYVDLGSTYTADKAARVFYRSRHALNGLDASAATTFTVEEENPLVIGASGYACLMRSVDLNEDSTTSALSTRRLNSSCPSGTLRLRVTAFLLRWSTAQRR